MIDETMETRLMAIFMCSDCGNGYVSSSVTIVTENKNLDVIGDDVLLSYSHISSNTVTYNNNKN